MKAITPISNRWLCLSSSKDGADLSQATLSLDNRGLAYGDGFFTTMGVIDGKILWLGYHHQRMISHARALQLDLDSHAIIPALQTHAEHLQQGMLKLIVTRTAQAVRGYGYASSESGSACDVWLKSSAMTVATNKQLILPNGNVVPVQPVSHAICLSAQIACLPPPLAGLKSLNRLDTVLVSAELQRIKAELPKVKSSDSYAALDIGEGLVRDVSGHWIEGTMSNVFYQLMDTPSLIVQNVNHTNKDKGHYLTTGQWYTPPMTQSGVAGVMRHVIMDALSITENPVVIRSLQDEDLPNIKQLFFCNALRGIMPMTSLRLLTGEAVRF